MAEGEENQVKCTMILYHYSKEPFGKLCSQPPEDVLENTHKPAALWISDEQDYGWFNFICDRKNSGTQDWGDIEDCYKYVTPFKLNLNEINNIVRIKTAPQLNDFTNHYRESQMKKCYNGYGVHIDWDRVKSDGFKGILITPFQRKLSRYGQKFHWYQFDCASGGFWDTSCLEKIGKSQLTPFRRNNP